ncbi:MAG: aminoacyl--tRNA ligase-related protein [Candidatus Woesearchaeota archaeon]
MAKSANTKENKDDDSENELELPKSITAKKGSDFSRWFNQVLSVSGIIDKRYNVKGCFVWLNYGYEIMLNIKKIWDSLLKENDYKELYFPQLVPLEYAKINEKWWNSFKKQAFFVTVPKEREPSYILRPTGEPAMYPMFKLWIRSYNDLPIRIYETVSSFRYETKHTRPLIRDREITVWHEIHTAHATMEEASEELKIHMKIWDEIWNELCLTPLKVEKPIWECFPGALGAVEYYSLMPSGKIMENGSCNNLGQAYAKKFDIKFKRADGTEDYAWMTCTGNGARLLAAVIGVHGDDNGLILPPKIAPIQVVIVPIFDDKNKNEIIEKSKQLLKKLKDNRIRAFLDESQDSVGSKFYNWEIKGVPLRIELGVREFSQNKFCIARRDLKKRELFNMEDVLSVVNKKLKEIEAELLNRSKSFLQENIVFAKNKKEAVENLKRNKIVEVYWCGSRECWDKIKEFGEGIELFGSDLKNEEREGECLVCQKKTYKTGYVANTY